MHEAVRTQVRLGIASVQKSWRPMLAVQCLTLAVGAGYVFSEGFRGSLEWLRAFKDASGIWFAVVAGFFAGSFIPELAKSAVHRGHGWKGAWLWNGVVFAGLGALVDTFYSFQALWFGHGTDIKTIALKTAIDMGIASVVLFLPFVAGGLAVSKEGAKGFLSPLTPKGYLRLVVPMIVPNWCFWTPVLFAVYALPLSLQFPFAWIAEASWCIALVAMSDDTATGH